MVDVREPLVAARELQAFRQSSTETNAIVNKAVEDLKMMDTTPNSASTGTDAGTTNVEAVVTVAASSSQRVLRGGQANEEELGKKLGPSQRPSPPHRNQSQGSEVQQHEEEQKQGLGKIFGQAAAAGGCNSGGPAAMETDNEDEKTPAVVAVADEAVHGTDGAMDMEATTEATEDEADQSGKEVPRCDSENLDSSPDSGRREASVQGNSNSRHICKHCAKEFSSGRALGGHMRAHGSLMGAEEVFSAAGADGVTEKQNQQLSGMSSMGHHHHGSHFFNNNSTDTGNDHSAVPLSVVVKQEGSTPPYSKRSRSNGKEIQSGRSVGGRRSKHSLGTGKQLQHREGTLKNSGEEIDNFTKQEEQEENNAGAPMTEPEPSVSSDDDGNNEGAMNEDDAVTDGAASNNNFCNVCDQEFDNSKQLNSHKKSHCLYVLRRNPKRSRRFMDQDFTAEAVVAAVSVPSSAKKTSSMFTSDGNMMHECSECDKRFQSWKALFGHMRCHPDRTWRGIRPPNGEVPPKDKQLLQGSSSAERQLTSSRRKDVTLPIAPSQESDSESEAEGKGGLDHTGHGKAPAAPAAAAGGASDNESDTESIEAAYMHNVERQPSSSSFNWQLFSKRSKRSRQIVRSLQAVTKTAAVPLSSSTPAENDEMEHETAMGLMMLARKEGGKEFWLGGGAAAGGRGSSCEIARRLPVESALSETERDDLDEQLDNDNASDSEDEEYDQKEHFVHHNNKGKGKLDSMDNVSLCEENEEGGDDCEADDLGPGSNKAKYMCNTCKRVFKSHQALGGHRASHKKVKGCFARTNVSDGVQDSPDEEMISEEFRSDEQLPTDLQDQSQSEGDDRERPQFSALSKEDSGEITNGNRNKCKGHICTICGRVFNSGQALGGHKRCHYNTKEATSSEATSSTNNTVKLPTAASHHQGAGGQSRIYKDEFVQQLGPPKLEESVYQPEKSVSEEFTQPAAQVRPVKEKFLDLNLPAPVNDDEMELEAYEMPPPNMMLAPLPEKIESKETPDFSSTIATVKSSNFDAELDSGKPKDGYFPRYTTSYPSLVEENNQDLDGGQDTGFRGEEVEFSLRYVQCNVCDRQFSAVEALSNHEKTHACMMSSVSGLTPISA
ncbi:unnamed protein product [Calypogeia fissa]